MAAHYFDTVENSVTGKPVSGASVSVLDAVDGAELTIYTDELLSEEASNPLTTDSTGFFEFYTDQDEGCLVIAYDGSTYRTIENVQFLGGSVSTDLSTLQARVDLHDTVFGTAASATSLGTFTGSTIADSSSVKTALQALETLVETHAAKSQTAEAISGFIASPSDKSYKLVVKIPHAGTITEVTTISASGTCTATFKVNSTALGGSANSVSSVEQSQSHASSNTFVAGDDIVLTVSSNSSCADLSFTIKYTRTLD